jgi:hypothetical protein
MDRGAVVELVALVGSMLAGLGITAAVMALVAGAPPAFLLRLQKDGRFAQPAGAALFGLRRAQPANDAQPRAARAQPLNRGRSRSG